MMKRVAVASTIMLLLGAGLLAYAHWGPGHGTIPLQAPLLLSSDREQAFPFHLQVTRNYQIDVVFPETANRDAILTLLGDRDRNTPGALQIDWAVQEGDRIVAHGSLRDLQYIPDVPRYGLVYFDVGHFNARGKTDYSLRLTSRAPSIGDYQIQPVIRVRVDGFNLYETRLSCTLVGIGLVILGAVALLISCSLLIIRPGAMHVNPTMSGRGHR